MLNCDAVGVNGEGDSVIGVGFVLVVVASTIREFVIGDVNHAVGGAVCSGRKGGGIGGARAGEVGKGAARDGDIRFDEVG